MARALSSSYSRLDTHIFLKVSNDAKMEPLPEKREGKGRVSKQKHPPSLPGSDLKYKHKLFQTVIISDTEWS